jgi:DNA-binding transcriptional MerR regulator
MLTIGQLAKMVDLRTSALRYYEGEGLLFPDDRTPAGYRLYQSSAVERVKLIQRAQRLGFSLAEIRTLIEHWKKGELENEHLVAFARERYAALERQITEQMVLQHELEMFLRDAYAQQQAHPDHAHDPFEELFGRICAHPSEKSRPDFLLNWLLDQPDCMLNTEDGQALIRSLRGQHVHVWKDEDSYQILFVSDDPNVRDAVVRLAEMEAGCETHPYASPSFIDHEEGALLVARGDNAFLYARLFMLLEREPEIYP